MISYGFDDFGMWIYEVSLMALMMSLSGLIMFSRDL